MVPIWKQLGSYGAQVRDTGTEQGDQRRHGEGTYIAERGKPGNRVPPQLGQAQIWGTDTLTKEQLLKASGELSEDPYQHVQANGGV